MSKTGRRAFEDGAAQPQEDDRRLLLRLEPDHQHGGGGDQLVVGDRAGARRGAGDVRGQERQLLGGVRAGAGVDVVGAQGHPGELGVGVGVLDGQPTAGQHAHPAVLAGGGEPGGGRGPGLGPRRRLQPAVPADQRGGQPGVGRGVPEGEATLVAVPLGVHRRVVTGQPAQHRPAAVVGALGAARGAVLADAGLAAQVERARAEPVGRAGERPDRADLHGVAGEVGLEGLVLVDRDLLQRAPVEQLDERVAGHLLGEPGAAGAQHAALAVQQHLGADRQRLGVGPLDAGEPALRVPVAHRLVLQRALPALVADRAVQRVVDQQQLQRAGLRGLGDLAGQLGLDHHVRGDRHGAGGHRLALALDLDQALPAGADRLQQRVVAEPRDLHADLLGGPDDQRARGHRDLEAVDGAPDVVLGRVRSRHRGHLRAGRFGGRHAMAPTGSSFSVRPSRPCSSAGRSAT